MTYLQVLLLFIVPPCLLLARRGRRGLAGFGVRGVWVIPALMTIAFVYTTPWDNYLIWQGVWDSPPDRILGRVGFVPIEEYLFFLLQPLLAGLWMGTVLDGRQHVGPDPSGGEKERPSSLWRGLAALFALAMATAGALMLRTPSTFYLGAILAWTGPVFAGMWWFMGPEIWAARRVVVLSLLPPTLYLWLVDAVALGQGAWAISPIYTTGVGLFGLPVEEALFFLTTNAMVIFGALLILHPAEGARVRLA